MKFKVLFFGATLVLFSCKHKIDFDSSSVVETNATTPPPDNNNNPPLDFSGNCDPDSVYFVNTIFPMVISNCTQSGCHNTADHEEGRDYTSYDGNRGGIMKDIKPGDPSDSKFLKYILKTNPSKVMPPPPAAPLSTTQIDLITTWINQGALNNSCISGCDTTNVTYSSQISLILDNSCKGCHSGSSPSGSVSITNFSDAESIALDGSLMGTLNQQSSYNLMPPGNALSQCEIDLIEVWVSEGAQNN